MKKIKQWMADIFEPEQFNDIDIFQVADALNDGEIRKRWFLAVLEEIKTINKNVDRRLLTGTGEIGLIDLCSRRKALQDVLEMVLTVKRQLKQEAEPGRHNPTGRGINLDRVTA